MPRTPWLLLLAALAPLATGCLDAPPTIVEASLVPPGSDQAGPHVVRAIVVDDRAVAKVSLFVALGAGDTYRSIPMRHAGDDLYRAALPSPGDQPVVRYYIEAVDVTDQVARAPEDAPTSVFGFRLTDAPPPDPPEVDAGTDPAADAGGDPDTGPGPGPDAGPDRDGGPGPGPGACGVSLGYPVDGTTLDPAEDDFDPDRPGLQTPVSAATDADDGTPVTLVVSGVGNLRGEVSGGLAEFESVTLPVGSVSIEVRVLATPPCSAKATLTVLRDDGGSGCSDDAECGGGGAICFRNRCVAPSACVSIEDCPAGMTCHRNACVRPSDLPADACDADEDCPAGLVCSFGLCTPEVCESADDCFVGERCFLGECIPDAVPAPPTCTTDEDCDRDDRQCLVGLCVPRQCSSDDECPADRPRCFSGFCLRFNVPVGECRSDDDCPGGQQCFLNRVCLPGFIPLPDSCTTADDCNDGEMCLFSACIRADCQVKQDCEAGMDCRFGFCMPEDLPPPVPGTCGNGRPPCPDGSSCLLTLCVPDALPIPRPCNADGTCPSERQRCVFGLLCFGF